MTERQLQQSGHLYLLDEELLQLHNRAKSVTRRLNATLETQREERKALTRELFGKAGEGAYIEPPFYCDYGYNTTVGKGFYCNYDCVFLDCGKIRQLGQDFPLDITIGHRVWIGGSVTVCPGVTIGENSVIGAGSVVTKDIPANVVAAGNPCRVIRPITKEDTAYWTAQLEQYRLLCDDPRV